MAAAGNLTLNANVTGGPDGARTFGPMTITTSAAVTETLVVALSVGANAIALPSGTTAVVISPPNSTLPAPSPAYGGTLTLKGVTGDTGVAISVKWPTLLGFDAINQPASLVITASAVCTVTVWLM